MGSAMRKMGVYLGLLEDTERYDEEYYDEYDERTQRSAVEEPARTAAVANISERRRPPPRRTASRTPSRAGHRRRALPDHHAAPADLQRGPHGRRELPRGRRR